MKLQQKLLAALLAVSFAGGAHAAMSNSVGGNGSLILGVVDTTAQVSATFDLGFNMDSFLPGNASYQSWNLAAGDYASAWSSFTAAANEAGSKFVVFAMDSLGTFTGDDRFLSTSSSDMTVATNKPSNSQLLTYVGASGGSNMDLAVNAANGLGNHGSVANGANFATISNGLAYVAQNGGAFGSAGKFSGVGPFVSWGDVNDVMGNAKALPFYLLATAPGSITTKGSITTYSDTFKLNSTTGELTYGVAVAAIPEADTWAMFAAGLLVVGAIARRRMQA